MSKPPVSKHTPWRVLVAPNQVDEARLPELARRAANGMYLWIALEESGALDGRDTGAGEFGSELARHRLHLGRTHVGGGSVDQVAA